MVFNTETIRCSEKNNITRDRLSIANSKTPKILDRTSKIRIVAGGIDGHKVPTIPRSARLSRAAEGASD